MNKAELIERIAEETGISKALASKVLDAAFKAISDSLTQGDSVTLAGFGSFSVQERAARTGRNPLSGKTITSKAARTPKFRAGASLRAAVAPTGGGGPGKKR